MNIETSEILICHYNGYLYMFIQFSKSFIKALFKVAAIFPQGKGKPGSFFDLLRTSNKYQVYGVTSGLTGLSMETKYVCHGLVGNGQRIITRY